MVCDKKIKELLAKFRKRQQYLLLRSLLFG